MRYFGKLSGLLFLLLLSSTSCKTYQWSGSSSFSCTSSIIESAPQCTITFTSAKNFDWTASSTVSGVTIQPSSGAEVAGMSSGDIHVTLPNDACPGPSGTYAAYTGSLNFTDDAQDLQLVLNIVSAGQGRCALKS